MVWRNCIASSWTGRASLPEDYPIARSELILGDQKSGKSRKEVFWSVPTTWEMGWA